MLTALTLCTYVDKDGHDAIRRKRSFGSTDPPCNSKYLSYVFFFFILKFCL